MSTTLRLLRIEARRSLGLWALPVMAGLAWWAGWRELPQTVTLWAEVSAGIRNGVLFIGPLAAALAAWVAGRDRRQGVEEMLTTTPLAASSRALAALSGTTLWAIVAFMAAAVALAVIAVTQATSSGPHLLTLTVGLTSVVAACALGFTLGLFISSRLVAPVVALVLFAGLAGLTQGTRPYDYLSPVDFQLVSVFYESPEAQGLPQIIWYLGLTWVAVGMVSLRRRFSLANLGALAAALAVTSAGAGLVVSAEFVPLVDERDPVPFQPVCSGEPVPVCVHPAYQELHAEANGVVQRMLAPVRGLPGVPLRMEQRSFMSGGAYDLQTDGTLLFELDQARIGKFGNSRLDYLASRVARAVVAGSSSPGLLTPAQRVVQVWLARSGVSHDQEATSDRTVIGRPGVGAEENAALDRFAALDPTVRRAWLEANFAALRAGELTLEDLP